MSGSKVNPNQWDGEIRSGGYLARNSKPTSANSPQWKGKYYLVGYGWIWLSAWERDSRKGLILKLSSQDMTDEHAEKFCKPKPSNSGKPQTAQQRRPPNSSHQNGGDSSDGDIPF